MTHTTSILTGLARRLAAIPELTFRDPRDDDSLYLPGENPITFGLLHATANEAVSITHYLDEPTESAATYDRVQVRTRHPNYLGGLALTDSIRDLLHDKRYVDLDGVRVSRIRFYSFLSMGPDGQGRHEWSQNFRLLGTR